MLGRRRRSWLAAGVELEQLVQQQTQTAPSCLRYAPRAGGDCDEGFGQLQMLLWVLLTRSLLLWDHGIPQSLAEQEEEEDKFERLESWLKENGASFPHLYMKRYSENYRGVHIRTTIGVRMRAAVEPLCATRFDILITALLIVSCVYACHPFGTPVLGAAERCRVDVYSSAVFDHGGDG